MRYFIIMCKYYIIYHIKCKTVELFIYEILKYFNLIEFNINSSVVKRSFETFEIFVSFTFRIHII